MNALDHRVYVVAPSRQRFIAWCFEQGYAPNDPLLRYVSRSEQLCGLHAADVRVLGYPPHTAEQFIDWMQRVDIATRSYG